MLMEEVKFHYKFVTKHILDAIEDHVNNNNNYKDMQVIQITPNYN